MRAAFIIVLALTALASAALAQIPRAVSGSYSGEYTCAQGLTGMTIEVRDAGANKAQAIVIFYEHPKNPGVPTGCFLANGTYDPATQRLVLNPGDWLVQPGANWSMVRIDGRVDLAAQSFAGRMVFDPSPSDCTTFTLKKNARPFKAAPNACKLSAAIS